MAFNELEIALGGALMRVLKNTDEYIGAVFVSILSPKDYPVEKRKQNATGAVRPLISLPPPRHSARLHSRCRPAGLNP